MTVTDLGLNRHEISILTTIEDSMPDGIHVQGIIRKIKMSPTTVNHYLPILENDHKMIFHERIKNKDIYKIKLIPLKTYKEQKKLYLESISALESTIKNAIKFASKCTLTEQLEIYSHMTNVLALIRYIQSSEVLDVKDLDSIPADHLQYIKELERISIMVSKSINRRIHPLHLLMTDDKISSSRKYLEEITKKSKLKN